MQNRKTIWLVNVNVQPPQYDTHLRHRKFAEMLIKEGYNVIVFGGSYLHHNKLNLINDSKKYITLKYGDIKYVFIKAPSYHSNGAKRMFSIFVFAWRLLCLCKKFSKPDMVVHNLHVPFDLPVYFVAKIFHAKYIAEIWDLWPQAFATLGLINKNSVFLKIAFQIENFLYAKSNKLIFTFEGGKDYIQEKKWDLQQGGNVDLSKCIYVNNGIDLDEFEYNRLIYVLNDVDLSDKEKFKVLYLGSINLSNDLKSLIDVANRLRYDSRIVFLIYGDGMERKKLKQYCEENSISNVIFKDNWINLKYVPYVVSCASLNVLNYKKNYDHKFGSSQGKLFQYLAAGKPILSNNIMGYDIINKYNAGLSKDIESIDEYANAIMNFVEMDKQTYKIVCDSAYNAAKFFDYKYLFKRYLEVFEDLI